jgi:hypothetical protein
MTWTASIGISMYEWSALPANDASMESPQKFPAKFWSRPMLIYRLSEVPIRTMIAATGTKKAVSENLVSTTQKGDGSISSLVTLDKSPVDPLEKEVVMEDLFNSCGICLQENLILATLAFEAKRPRSRMS